jgi:hypothetical protein
MTTAFSILNIRKPVTPPPDPSPNKKKRKWKQVRSLIFHPMFYLSLLIHGGLMLIPSTPEQKVEEKPEKKPDEISLTALKPIAPAKPLAKAAPKVPIKATIPPRIPVPANRVPAIALPKSATVHVPAPPKPVAAQPAAAQPAAAPEAAQPSAIAAPAPTEADYSGQFASALPGMSNSETANLGVPCNLFAQPEKFFTPASLQTCLSTGADPEWITPPGVAAFAWETRKTTEDVQAKLKTQFAGFSFTAAGQYGGGTLFELKQGATIRYVNVLETSDGTGALVVIWEGNPNAPAR